MRIGTKHASQESEMNSYAPPGESVELTVLMPCLNEARTLAACIRKAQDYLRRSALTGEILIADNGSTDGSQRIATELGARVINVSTGGYGAALIAGIENARGRYVIMGDSDDSYDFTHLDDFVQALRQGYQLVMGNRFRGGIKAGAMPALHRYLGNPVLSFIGRLFFKSPIGDFHCGLRGFDREAMLSLGLQSTGMEFASEMVVKSTLRKLKICEVPTTLHPDGRDRPPHLRSWRDGWRHLKFLLLLSPRWLFLYPGLFLLLSGLLLQFVLFKGPLFFGHIGLGIHTMLYVAGSAILGVQMLSFALFTKVLGMRQGLLPHDSRVENFLRVWTIDRGLITGAVLLVLGIATGGYSVYLWERSEFGPIDPAEVMRYVIPSVTLFVIGAQLVLTSAFLGVLAMGVPRNAGQS